MYVESPLHSLRDRMLALRSLPTFVGLRDETLLEVSEHARERRFRRGEELVAADVPVDRIYIVFAGKVTTTRNGNPFMVVEGSGSVGILAVLGSVPLGWRAVADLDTLTLEIPAAAFLTSLEEDFPLLRNTIRVVASMALQARGGLPVSPAAGSAPVNIGTIPERDPTLVERIIALRSGGLFATANMDALIELSRRMTPLRVPAGHVFFEVGDPSTYSLRIIAGRVRCTNAAGIHVDVGAEMVLGAMDSWAGKPRSYSARAETAVSGSWMKSEDFLAVVEMHPSLALNMLRLMARSLIPGD